VSYYQLATDLLLKGVRVAAIEADYGLVFRQGKGVDDILHAVKKVRDPKIGRAKIETEIGMLEVYLKSILKHPKKEGNGSEDR
jgi:hypothetical protein